MIPGVLALFERSLRIDAKSWGPHLTRLGLMVTIYLAVCYAVETSAIYGAPGLRFFQSITYLNLVFMTLLGIGFFSTTITEEKEEDTLGLMLMAGISPLGILLGKSGGRLFQSILLVAIQYPFTFLAVTMGGVTQEQIQSAYAAIFAYLVMLAGVGLFCSTVASRNRTASIRMTVVLVTYFLVPLICTDCVDFFGSTNFKTSYGQLVIWTAESCVFFQIGSIFATGSHEELFSRQVITNTLIGGLGFVLSWALFNAAIKETSTEPIARGFLARNRGLIRLFATGRPRFNPLIWKDFHFVSGGIAGLLVRSILSILLYVGICLYGIAFGEIIWSPFEWEINTWEAITGTYLVLMSFAITFDAGAILSRSIHQEIRGQTLATLMMLPNSSVRILYSKFAGSLLGWLPGPACMFFVSALMPGGLEIVAEFFEYPGSAILIVAQFVLFPHAAALIATFVRWGTMPLAIGFSLAELILVAFLCAYCVQAGSAQEADAIEMIFGFTTFVICAFCHLAVGLRIQAISAK